LKYVILLKMEKSKIPFQIIHFSPSGKLFVLVFGNQFQVVDTGRLEFIKCNELKNQSNFHSGIIRSVYFSDNEELLITAGDDKQIKLWEVDQWKFISSRTATKKVSAVVFAPNATKEKGKDQNSDSFLVYADKFGDAFGSPVPELSKQDLLLGHCSIITSMILSPNRKYLITGEKDEKIRVSNFPKVYDIQSFCLGHTSYISKLAIPKSFPDLLISGGGDGTLRLWKYQTGKLLDTLIVLDNENEEEEDEESVVSALTYCDINHMVAVLLEKHSLLRFYEIKNPATEKAELELFQTFPLKFNPIDAVFDHKGTLWISGKSPFLIQTFVKSAHGYILQDPTPLVQLISEKGSMEEETSKIEEIVASISLKNFEKQTKQKKKQKRNE